MITLQDLIARLPNVKAVGNVSGGFNRLVAADKADFDSHTLTWVSDKNQKLISSIDAGIVICSDLIGQHIFQPSCTYLIVSNPRKYFSDVIKIFFNEDEAREISPLSSVDPSCRIGVNVSIKAGVRIERGCSIGDNTIIDCNTVIKRESKIGNNVKIGANNTIGGVGFGYEKNELGEFELIPHIGNVIIEDNVEIGNNTTIDRAVLGSTILRENCKVDNLVHIAHGVEIGENSLIIANAMIAGSTKIGKNVWVSPSASILNKLEVGDNSVIGMGAVVIRNVSRGQIIIGNPGKELSGKRD